MIKYLSSIFVLFVFSYLNAVAAAPDLYLTNQDGVRTTQFGSGDSIYIEGTCPVASSAGDSIHIYIAFDKTWASGDQLSDVSARIESLAVSSDEIPRTLIWKPPLNDGSYDVLIDVNNDYILQGYENCILGATNTGFRVGNVAPPPPPPPTPTPLPPPPPPTLPAPSTEPAPSPEPSQNFSLNDLVKVKNFANVRKSPGGSQLGQQGEGARGIIVGGPIKASLGGQSYWFWNVNFDTDPDGWVADQTLTKASALSLSAEKPKEEPITKKTNGSEVVLETAAQKEISQDQKTEKGELAQVSGSNINAGTNPLMGTIIIGAALFFGLIIGSFVISRAIRRN